MRTRTRLARALAAAAALVTALGVAAPPAARAQAVEEPLGPVVVLAHRGQSFDAPEHTVPAYDLAVASGADFLECDLQLTADEVLVCVHDTTVDRTSDGTGRVDAFTFAELQQLDFGSWFNEDNPERARPEYAGLRVVAFADQLDCYRAINPRLRYHIETKAPSEYDGRMEPLLVELLASRGLVPEGEADPQSSPVIVQSFELASLEAVKALAPSLPTAFLALGFADPQQAAGQFPDTVDVAAPNAAYLLANPGFPALAHDNGREVHTYTVDDPMQIQRLLDLGVDGIFTNRADVLRGIVDARGTGVPAEVRATPADFTRGCPAPAGPPAPPPPPTPEPPAETSTPPASTRSVTRLEADDAVSAALAWSATLPDGRGGEVLLARDDLFVEALASGGAQGLLDAPLLLTGGDELDPRTAAELRRLDAERVTLLGGTAALSEAVEAEVADLGPAVRRAVGATRTDTAAALARLGEAETTTAVLARAYGADDAQAFADSLAAGASAAAQRRSVLVTDGAALSTAAGAALRDAGAERVVVAGGEDAVGRPVADALQSDGLEVVRTAGGERAATAVAVAEERGLPAGTAPRVLLVDGARPDAWAGGFPAALAAAEGNAPVLLSLGDTLPPPTLGYLEASRGADLICGPLTSAAACDAAAAALR